MKHIFALALTLILSVSLFAHTNEEIEDELVNLFGDIDKNSSYSADSSEDSYQKLGDANIAFRTRLLELTAQHPSLLSYNFPALVEFVKIKTSPDGHLKIFSWDTLSGGTMHFYENVYQFRGVEGVYSTGSFNDEDEREGEPGAFAHEIQNIETKTGTVYLVSTTAVLSTSYRAEAVSAFQIDGNTLSNGVTIFKTASGITHSLGFAYDFFSVVEREERPIQLFEYDRKTKTLSFPVVIEDDKMPQGRVTDARIRYRYDGTYFVRIKK